MMRDDSFWKEYRPTELTKSEDNMGQFVDNLAKIKDSSTSYLWPGLYRKLC